MANSANVPNLGSKIVDDIPMLKAVIRRMMQCNLTDTTDLPIWAKQLVDGGDTGWEIHQYNGTSWVRLSRWNINAQQVDGFSASQSVVENSIPVRDKNGKLAGDILGNAATASKAAALSAVNPVGMGGTGGSTAAAARENLGITDLFEGVNADIDAANLAIASLESGVASLSSALAALDAAAVHIKGSETVTGAKTFAQNITMSLAAPQFLIKQTDADRSIKPSTDQYAQVRFLDKNDQLMGALVNLQAASGVNTSSLTVYGKDGKNVGISVSIDADGTSYASAPPPPAGSTGMQIVTAGYLTSTLNSALNGALAGVVHTTGAESISGTKTFANAPVILNSEPSILLRDTGQEKNVAPESDQFSSVSFRDKNNASVGEVQHARRVGGQAETLLVAYQMGGTASATIGVGIASNGTAYGVAPTPAKDSNADHIATTGWVKAFAPYIIETGRDGSNWYTKWSDGRIEQGGYFTCPTTFDVVPLNVSFASTDYSLVVTPYQYNVSGGGGREYTALPGQKTRETFSVSNLTAGRAIMWEAKGY